MIMMPALLVMFMSLVALWFIYGGFATVLRFIAAIRKCFGGLVTGSADTPEQPRVQIGLTVFFWPLMRKITSPKFIANITAQDYPKESLEIVVVSDGSTDNTGLCVRRSINKYPEWNIRFFEFQPSAREGRRTKSRCGDRET